MPLFTTFKLFGIDQTYKNHPERDFSIAYALVIAGTTCAAIGAVALAGNKNIYRTMIILESGMTCTPFLLVLCPASSQNTRKY